VKAPAAAAAASMNTAGAAAGAGPAFPPHASTSFTTGLFSASAEPSAAAAQTPTRQQASGAFASAAPQQPAAAAASFSFGSHARAQATTPDPYAKRSAAPGATPSLFNLGSSGEHPCQALPLLVSGCEMHVMMCLHATTHACMLCCCLG
jgi:hypothetical protein